MNKKKLITITNLLIVVNIIMYGVQNTIQNGTILFGLNIYFLKYELWFQPLSTMFVHGGLAHILMNMFVLFQFGTQIENAIGKLRFILLYIIGGLLTSIGSFAYMYYSSDWANLVGASGAISVLLGFVALRDKFNRKGIIIWVLLISLLPLFIGIPIAWYAHFIGFALGWLMGYLI